METSHQDHLFSMLHHYCSLLSLILSTAMHILIFFSNYHPMYHLIPTFITLLFHRLIFSTPQIRIIDFSCLKPDKHLRVPIASLLEHFNLVKRFDKESIAFMTKVITSSGIGEETHLPPALRLIPVSPTHEDTIQESHMLFFPTLDELFAKTKVSPQEIDLLVVNCSGFCPSPSLSSIVVNRYNMRSDVKNYNISGMGCSAGVLGIDIANRFLMRRRERAYALVVSTEIVSVGWYNGKDQRKLLLNCLFRMGCAAVLLTNQRQTGTLQPKYRLTHLLRTQNAYDDSAYNSASREEDDEGITGFSIQRHIGKAVADLVTSHLRLLGPMILPWEEKFKYVMYRLLHKKYVPNFAKAMKHLCIPSSSQTLIKTAGKGLGLHENALEAALATLHRYGNQSSSSMLYQMAYLEAKGKIKKGDRVLQLGIGSGLKCNSLVLECVRDFENDLKANPWGDCLHQYPACMH
ncbi:3-ketoacyl-CoA synthase [Rhynchospora pubera]|uniref:3-ketoacyl-CoA synthase n=1 Tax=Rhynchospora pubera TaxID=906938 RepID=A0AAV8E6X5_9POAL|nr:3-ketoacyl-CoA synthase [Rhynchospora pubera]